MSDESKPTQKTAKGYEVPARSREATLRDFEKISRPLRKKKPQRKKPQRG
jgi:hypothetical protein